MEIVYIGLTFHQESSPNEGSVVRQSQVDFGLEKSPTLQYDQCITDQDYQHALDVWKTLNIKTLGEYSDLYFLADIFENFRRTCLLTYELDPLHFYTAPGLAFDAMLKTTGVQLELLTDIEKLMFIERGIRGGVSQCSNRYAKANNKYMKDEYDSNQESTYLMYFDINNLYGAAMSEYLPYGEFEFLEANEIENLDILNIPDDAEVGYIFDCDLDYPTYLHQLHSDLPLAPQHMTPPIPSRSKLKKLLLTLYPRNNYSRCILRVEREEDRDFRLFKVIRE
ncbi:hypothetical protein NQ315_008776 [Exocentrus adspersus]|uniref:DNA-directed DNA polymerase n=1 Tax=Exocentrus adspersus TaxID=1586481 RepID=A0AAV8VGW5_9CUCU|nr:hypothetical protein NQ315_008776 [Exocentrus adspersus]